MIIVSIDVTKLDKERFITGKNGAKYCDLVLIDHPNDYGDGFVKQGVSKEEREARVEMPILGNFKIVGGSKPAPQRQRSSPPPHRPAPAQRPRDPDLERERDPEDDIPFKYRPQKRRSNLL